MVESSAGSQDSFLKRILSQLSFQTYLTYSQEESDPVAVIAIQRYLSDRKSQSDFGAYSYDVTVTDGIRKIKCFLDPSLNHLVQTNTLGCGRDVHITRCSFVHNERNLAHGYVRIDKLECGSGGRSVILDGIRDVSQLALLVKCGMERSELLFSDRPLDPTRKHYLNLWHNDEPVGDMWTSESPLTDIGVLDMSTINFLCNVANQKRSQLPLLVKVIHKSRLRYYGKLGQNAYFPYQAYFEVADQSGTMSMVLWNELCPQFYQRLCVGTVLHLKNYLVKASYSHRTRPQMDHYRFKSFKSVEISLNANNPPSVITIIPPKRVQPQWGLPQVSFQFIPRSEVDSLVSNSACDVIGLVMFVGRVERMKSKLNAAVPEKYCTYRWVHAMDDTSQHPFILELFSSSQSEIFTSISPMSHIVCTQMRVCHVEGSQPYLTSSSETQIFITGYHKGQPYVSEARVKNFIQWTKTLKDNKVLGKSAVGGYYCYPHLPGTFHTSQEEAKIPLVAAHEVKTELESLCYRERKQLAVQGHIIAARYMRSFSGAQESAGSQVLQAATQTDRATDGSSSPPIPDAPVPKKRRLQASNVKGPLSSSSSSGYEEDRQVAGGSHSESRRAPPTELCWESSRWPQEHLNVAERLSVGGLSPHSLTRWFSLESKDVQLQWLNLQPDRWTHEWSSGPWAEVACPGYFILTILGINREISIDAVFYPVTYTTDPRAVGLPAVPHDNTLLSCLTSGYISPLGGTAGQSPVAQPEQLLETAAELQDTHLVCVLDLCHLGRKEVEIMVSKVYNVADMPVE